MEHAKIAERLKQLRSERGYSQKHVSQDVGMTVTGYQNYELGTRVPRIEQLILLARYYDVSLDYLVGLTDDPSRH